MNAYTYEEMEVGRKESFTVQVTEADMDAFRAVTGDGNPLHADDGFARDKGYEGKVAFGMLTASYLSTLAGVYLPGERSLIQSVETKFLKPVYPGDTLSVSGEITEKNDTYSLIFVKAEIRNQKGEKVLRGKLQIQVI
ncbi:MAG: MaoC family dehydratase [Lachnospiraceae bacterium]|nr:MaoC family dehydratase [Lachnospiraceae bacterium]